MELWGQASEQLEDWLALQAELSELVLQQLDQLAQEWLAVQTELSELVLQQLDHLEEY